jgi:hypothetical protein
MIISHEHALENLDTGEAYIYAYHYLYGLVEGLVDGRMDPATFKTAAEELDVAMLNRVQPLDSPGANGPPAAPGRVE